MPTELPPTVTHTAHTNAREAHFLMGMQMRSVGAWIKDRKLFPTSATKTKINVLRVFFILFGLLLLFFRLLLLVAAVLWALFFVHILLARDLKSAKWNCECVVLSKCIHYSFTRRNKARPKKSFQRRKYDEMLNNKYHLLTACNTRRQQPWTEGVSDIERVREWEKKTEECGTRARIDEPRCACVKSWWSRWFWFFFFLLPPRHRVCTVCVSLMLSIMFFYLLFLPFRSLIVRPVLVGYKNTCTYLRWRARLRRDVRRTCGPMFIVLHLTCFCPSSQSLARSLVRSFIIISSFTVYHVHSLNRWATVSGYLCYPSHHVHYGLLLLVFMFRAILCSMLAARTFLVCTKCLLARNPFIMSHVPHTHRIVSHVNGLRWILVVFVYCAWRVHGASDMYVVGFVRHIWVKFSKRNAQTHTFCFRNFQIGNLNWNTLSLRYVYVYCDNRGT